MMKMTLKLSERNNVMQEQRKKRCTIGMRSVVREERGRREGGRDGYKCSIEACFAMLTLMAYEWNMSGV